MKKSSIFSIATTLKRLPEDCQVYTFIPPKLHNYAPPVTQEMLERFERIHDTIKWISGGYIAFLSFYWVQSSIIPPIVCLIVLELFVFLMGLSVLRLYWSIYNVGSYIGVVLENKSDLKWHTMSRFYGDYLKEYERRPERVKRPFPFGERWGGDSSQVSILLIALNIIALIIFVCFSIQNYKPELIFEHFKSLPSINNIISFSFVSIAILIILFNFYICKKLWHI